MSDQPRAHPHAGSYRNDSTQQWEAWAVNVTTGQEILLGSCSYIVGEEARRAWESDIWRGFLRKFGAHFDGDEER